MRATPKASTKTSASRRPSSTTRSRSHAAVARPARTRKGSAGTATRARAATSVAARGARGKTRRRGVSRAPIAQRTRVGVRNSSRLRPFTIEHYLEWCSELVLDNGERFKPEQFQIDFVADLFAGRLENWLILPEGNGKTTLIASLILYHCEFTLSAYVPVAASSRDQAEILYRQAEGFVFRTPRLHKIQKNGKEFFECQDGHRRIKCRTTRARIQIFAADAKTGDGLIPTLAIIEELHRHKDLTLYRTWRGKMRKRKGSQLVAISTAGEPYSDFEETREKIRQLPGATRRETFTRAASEQIVIHDWSVPPKGDVTNMRLVKKANPFSAITPESLQEDFESPTQTLAHWSRFKCNIATRAVRSAITDAEWEKALTKEVIPEGTRVSVGLDVGWKWDTCGIVPLWIRDRDFRLLGPATILTPPRNGDSLPVDDLHRAILELNERTPIDTVVMDITRAEETAQWLKDELHVEVVEWSQGNENEVVQYEKFMTGLRTHWLWHTGDRGLTRHVMNAVARMLPNARSRFDRPAVTRQVKSQEAQDARVIDALTAASMVIAYTAIQLGEDTEPMVSWG